MGKGGGGGSSAAAEMAAREAARRSRIAGNVQAVKERFFAKANPRVVPDASSVPAPIYATRMVRRQFHDDPYNDPVYRMVPEQYATNQAEIDAAQKAIDDAVAYNQNLPLSDNPTAERLAAFEDIEQRVRNRFLPEFQDTTTDARRELKFALARRGIFGGSAQADAERRFRDRVVQGENEIASRAVAARNEKERLDNNLMNNLINQAQADTERSALLSGIGATQLSNANRAMSSATDRALATNFADVGTLFKRINDQNALRAGIGNNTALAQLLGNRMGSNILSTNYSGGGNYGSIT
tara:strand:- start:1773 stop:2663 length:891 start_codon:yes stop_codon:yes gene_type:complete